MTPKMPIFREKKAARLTLLCSSGGKIGRTGSTCPNGREAEEEALWTARAIAGYSISYPVVYDCEGYGDAESRMHDVGKKERTANAVSFLGKISDEGYDAMFYSAADKMSSNADWDMAKIEKDYMIWVARYPDDPRPDRDEPDYDRVFHAWQYTNQGRVDGIFGNVDLDVSYFTRKRAEPRDMSAVPKTPAKAPLTDEEKIYRSVNETVTAKDETNLRTKPSTSDSEVVYMLKKGEYVKRVGINKATGWSKLIYNGQTVYAVTSLLEP